MAHDEGAVCRCVVEHRPSVLEYERHHILPIYLGGNTDGETVWVCLAPEAQVLMADGNSRPIWTLAIGDRVMAYDGTATPIAAVSKSWFDGDLIVLDELSMTPEHLVLTPIGWTRAGDVGTQQAVLSQPFDVGVESHVLSLILTEPEVAKPVVQRVEVDVVDDFDFGQFTPQGGLHDQPVLGHDTTDIVLPRNQDAVPPLVDVTSPLPFGGSRDAVEGCEPARIRTVNGPIPGASAAFAPGAHRAEGPSALLACRHRPAPLAAVRRAGVRAGHVGPLREPTGNLELGRALDAGTSDHRQIGATGVARWHALDHVGSRGYSGWVYDITIPGYRSYYAEGMLVHNCPNAHANCHELLRLMLAAGRTLTDSELQAVEDRPVSRYAAVLARDGFNRWRALIPEGAT